jgi:hypothetical protein
VTEQQALVSISSGVGEVVVVGNHTASYPAAGKIRIYGTNGNDGVYVIDSSSFGGGNTTVVVDTPPLVNDNADGFATPGEVDEFELGYCGTRGVIGVQVGAQWQNGSGPDIFASDGAVLQVEGDWSAFFPDGADAFLDGAGNNPFEVEGVSFAAGVTTITLDVVPEYNTPSNYGSVIRGRSFLSEPPDYPQNLAFDITEIRNGDGVLRFIIEYEIMDVPEA